MQTEKLIETELLDYLNTIPWCYAFKLNNVGVYDPIKKIYRMPRSRHIVKGISDITGVYKGKALFIEVKTPRTYRAFMNVTRNQHTLNKTNMHYLRQWSFICRIRDKGGIAFVADSVNRCKSELENE